MIYLEAIYWIYMLILRLATLPPSAYPDTVAIALAILFGIGMVTSTLLYLKHVAVRETNRIINSFEKLVSQKEK